MADRSGVRFEVRQHVNNAKFNRMFRSLSRDVSGTSCDIPDKNRILFGYVNHPYPNTLAAVMSFSLADSKSVQISDEFDCVFFHHITFLFVKKSFQAEGYGSQMIHRCLNLMKQHNAHRPVRVQSAYKSIGFFEKQGFKKVGDAYDTPCSGSSGSSPLFHCILDMERQLH